MSQHYVGTTLLCRKVYQAAKTRKLERADAGKQARHGCIQFQHHALTYNDLQQTLNCRRCNPQCRSNMVVLPVPKAITLYRSG